jgi:hypothetical protein
MPNLALFARAAVDAIGPMLASFQKRLTEVTTKADLRVAELEAEVRGLRERAAQVPRDGRDGRDGADATFREPADYEAGKHYSHGAIVRHRGGLWHAHRATDLDPAVEKSGWTSIVAGVTDVTVRQGEDARSMVITVTLSEGTVIERAFELPILIYRGVHREGRYAAGDAVTHQGSLWIARAATERRPGSEGGAQDWQLAVKKGRDGKDGDPGAGAPRYCGFYDPRLSYEANTIVRTSSGLWLTTRATASPPPSRVDQGSPDWTCYLPAGNA